MSNIDYTKICPEFYTNYEDGCCMENCTFESKGYCPVQYVKGLLEEKDKVIENWQTMYESVMQTCSNDAKEIDRLNKLLAEKEQEIEFANKQVLEAENQLEKQASIHYRHLKEKDQDKISFAVEKLEKVKEIIAKHTQELWTCENDDIDIVLYEEIDNQIKQLKEGK